jgi:hypothetical protein
MPMLRRVNMGLSIAGGSEIAKPCGTILKHTVLGDAAGPDFR